MTKTKALGVALQLGDGGATEVFTNVAQLSRVGGVKIVTEVVDTTVHDSTGGFREHIESGVKAYGEIPFEGFWDEALATHDDTDGLRSKAEGAGPHNWKIIYPDASTTTGSLAASLIDLEVGDAPIDGALPISGTLRVSGDIAWS